MRPTIAAGTPPTPCIRRYLRHGLLPQLAAFEAIMRLGSFTRAAEALHMAQPTVSGHVRKLSDAIGLRLFDSTGKAPTAAARVLERAAHEVFDAFARAEAALAGLRGAGDAVAAERPALSIVASLDAGALAAWLPRFAGERPELDLGLHLLGAAALCERLARAADDLYLVSAWPAVWQGAGAAPLAHIESLDVTALPASLFAVMPVGSPRHEAARAFVELLRGPAPGAPALPGPVPVRPVLRVVV
jgi:hypothetical protein